jgi:small conductance mechanosensitive channel
MHVHEYLLFLQDAVQKYALSVVAAIVIFLVGRWVAGLVRRLLKRLMGRRGTDVTLISFLSNMAYALMLAFVIIAALSRLGIETTSLIAVLGAAGLAVGLALQGSLSNFAAGVMLIVFRPFKVGDFVEAGGVTGGVREITIFTTVMTTPDNKTIIVPNGKIIGDVITNYTKQEMRRIDLDFSVAHGSDLLRAKNLLMEIIAADPRVLAEPAPFVGVLEINERGVRFTVRPWAKTTDYWDVYFDLTEAMKLRFDAEGMRPAVMSSIMITSQDS